MPDLFIGLMSGTSVDAVDGALVDFAGARPETLSFASLPMPAALRGELLALQRPGPDELARAARATVALADLYAEVVHRLLADARLDAAAVGAIGAHGQTVRHRPEEGYTLQLMDGARLAERSGIAVACDFRSADVAAGGQGAPLVPAFHAGAFTHPSRRRAVVNIGGIANVSLLAPGETVRGHDTGPGNLLLDLWCERHTGAPYDRDGAWGAGGRVLPALLERLLDEPYFRLAPPKSTGRDLFHAEWLDARLAGAGAEPGAGGAGPSAGATTTPPLPDPADVQATLAELTALTISQACSAFRADEVFICGGGARNLLLMQRLGALCAPATVAATDSLGAASQAVEAVAFAWLAAQRLRGEPGNLPEVTGARGPRVLGALYPAPLRALAPAA
ncbi:anhydro-N-acetylmuramic acid kinase [Quisquiliibacterium transsilvanicum]|uniref:Anhydro-N-acetylmuramic acid kinase n=1 Tax=Quisquiliibacterium transsilvanicum TaxID=1549638 RepID=A0A7W8HK02_9BURK|nr:anhydro-N-acetylmuramic acid kinase [Quisquiliibacterium transsilvanicum]MBB5273425.1 anhydro-N-acetylmuramic acid kinase [Quisquiliibacterium transsilvanicum]